MGCFLYTLIHLLELENDNKHAHTQKNISRTSRVELIVYFLWQGDLNINHLDKLEVIKNEFKNTMEQDPFAIDMGLSLAFSIAN